MAVGVGLGQPRPLVVVGVTTGGGVVDAVRGKDEDEVTAEEEDATAGEDASVSDGNGATDVEVLFTAGIRIAATTLAFWTKFLLASFR